MVQPATLQATANVIMGDLLINTHSQYIDDSICHTKSGFETHIEALRRGFLRLRDGGVKLKAKKCEFNVKSIDVFGFTVDEDGSRPQASKVEDVVNFPTPTCTKDVRSFLGLAGFYRRYINDFSKKAAALNGLLKKDVRFLWQSDHDESFQQQKRDITSEPVCVILTIQRSS